MAPPYFATQRVWAQALMPVMEDGNSQRLLRSCWPQFRREAEPTPSLVLEVTSDLVGSAAGEREALS